MRILTRKEILHIPQIILIYLQSTNLSIQIAQISITVEIVQIKGSNNIFCLLDTLCEFQIVVLAIDIYQYQFFIQGTHQKVAILTVFFLSKAYLFYTEDSRFCLRYLKASFIHRYHQQNINIRGIIIIKDINLIINFLLYQKQLKLHSYFYLAKYFFNSNEYYNYTMINKKSCSSFSSFQNDWENQPHFQEPKMDKKHKTKVATRQNNFQPHKNDTLYFSQFQEDTFENKFEVLAKEDRIIKKLKDQIEILKKQNHKLIITNRQLIDDLQRTKQVNVRLEEKMMMKGYEELKAVGKKQKIQSLIQQIDRVKDNMNRLRAQSDKDKLHIASLKSQLFCYQKMQVDWTWKDKFIELFVDMLDKITTGIDLKWTNKKKIQVGWKVVKNLVHKALVAGIKPPRVQRNRQ